MYSCLVWRKLYEKWLNAISGFVADVSRLLLMFCELRQINKNHFITANDETACHSIWGDRFWILTTLYYSRGYLDIFLSLANPISLIYSMETATVLPKSFSAQGNVWEVSCDFGTALMCAEILFFLHWLHVTLTSVNFQLLGNSRSILDVLDKLWNEQKPLSMYNTHTQDCLVCVHL